jgi:hypothetical protein
MRTKSVRLSLFNSQSFWLHAPPTILSAFLVVLLLSVPHKSDQVLPLTHFCPDSVHISGHCMDISMQLITAIILAVSGFIESKDAYGINPCVGTNKSNVWWPHPAIHISRQVNQNRQ